MKDKRPPWYTPVDPKAERNFFDEQSNPRILEYLNTLVLVWMTVMNDSKHMITHMEDEGLGQTETAILARKAYSAAVNHLKKVKTLRKRIEKATAEVDSLAAQRKRLSDFQNSLVPEDLLDDKPKGKEEQDLRDIFG